MAGIVIVGAVLIGLATWLLIRAFALPNANAMERIQQIESYGFTGAGPLPASGRQRQPALRDLAMAVGRWAISRSPRISESAVRRELTRAGMYSTSPVAFTGYRFVAAVAGGLLFLLFLIAVGSSVGVIIVFTPIAAIAGFVLPRAIVQRRIRERATRIDRQLPELVDILVITVEAGIGLSRSLRVAAGRLPAPLGDELRLTIQEEQMGLSTSDALANMLERCDAPGMRSFVRSLSQGQTLGISIGDIMRGLAGEMRTRRRQSAETQAQKAPIKILFPLVLLIFPALFVVLLYPAAHNLLDSL